MKKLNGHIKQTIQEEYKILADYAAHISKDQYGMGKFLNEFEQEVADLVGMDAAIFLPSGVMAQLIALKIWGEEKKNHTFACHESCHLIRHEEDAYKELLDFQVRFLGSKDIVPGASDINDLDNSISSVIYELPMRHLGGDLPSFEEWKAIKDTCKSKKIKLHIDGARLFEATAYYKRDMKEIVHGADSLFLSFYKGFGSTSGSMLLGSRGFIERAKVWLRRFGGNLFQLYPLAIPAKMNFDKRKNDFTKWTDKCSDVSRLLKQEFDLKTIPYPTKTNMFHLYLPNTKEKLRENMKSSKDMDISVGIWEETEDGKSRIEFTVGSGTMELTHDDIKEAFKRLLKT